MRGGGREREANLISEKSDDRKQRETGRWEIGRSENPKELN